MVAGERLVRRRPPAQRFLSRIRWKHLVLLGVAAAGLSALLVPVSATSVRLVWNVTPSAPAGLYLIERETWQAGDRVAVLPSEDLAKDLADRGVLSKGKLLIKRALAVGGDTVCRKGGAVTLNGRLVATARRADSHGRALPIWTGCVTLTMSDVFLLGDAEGSYDGRYFGITSAREVLGRAAEILTFG